ncbi:MAG: COGs COG0840, partial [uncultured Solirubrobacteraceae bacterium]
VSQHPHPPQLRSARDRRRGPRRGPAVRAQDQRLHEAVAGERRGVRARGRGRRPHLRAPARRARDQRPAEGPRDRGRQGARPRAEALRSV